ncbi:MAG: FadR/GntR family transcriptional regulator [Acidobacteriota bacterium]
MPRGAKVASGNVADRVSKYLVGYIRRHALMPGAPLPSEIRASAELGVSRGIVREVYRSLSTSGIVETANGRRPRVSRVSNRVLTRLLQHALSTRQISAEQMLELRRPIELLAVELAATRRTDDDVLALRRAVVTMKAAGLRREAFVRADVRFHEIIGRATGNPLFGLVASALRESMELSVRIGVRSPRANFQQVIDTHEGIVTAIDRGRPDVARRLMALHFDEARANVLRSELDRAQATATPRPRSRPRALPRKKP